VTIRREDAVHLGGKRAVQVPAVFRRLDKLVRGLPAEKLLAGEEMVVLSVPLAVPWLSRRG
jgi:hypothetical protein